MRERDRQLKRRRHRRLKRLKRRNQDEAQHRTERPAGSKRSVKKAPPAPAEASQGGGIPVDAGEGPKKKAPAKKAPVAKKAPAAKPESEGEAADGGSGPEEPKAG